MATATGTVTVSAGSGTASASGTVTVSPPANSASATGTVTVTQPPAYLQVWDGSAFVTVQLGRYNGTSIVWLSPAL